VRLGRLGQAMADKARAYRLRRRVAAEQLDRRRLRERVQQQRFRMLTHSQRRDMEEKERLRQADMAERRRRAPSLESPGRRIGKVAGSWIDDIAAVRQMVLLCWQCKPKWAPNDKPSNPQYVYDKYLYAKGKCDGCRSLVLGNNERLHVFTHECYLQTGYQLAPPAR